MFDAFNARDLNPSEVASSFVPSEKFDELLGHSHALLIGPRGSGKTTLLRMLSVEALRQWMHPRADDYRARIGYTGIFVPADTTWREMVAALGGRSLPADAKATLGEAAFGLNVFLATAETMELRLEGDTADAYRCVTASEGIEGFIDRVAEQWGLAPRSLSLRGLAEAIRRMLAELYSRAKVFAASSDHSIRALHEAIPFTRVEVFSALEYGLKEFDTLVGDRNGRWALLFDEFEVVPPHIQRRVLEKLRAAPFKIVYKVGLAPCGLQTDVDAGAMLQPHPRDDVKQILLWYTDKKDVIAFCKDLLQSRLQREPTLANLQPEAFLGTSHYVAEEASSDSFDLFDERTTGWAGIWEKEFASLARKDASFQNYLKLAGLHASRLNPSTRSQHGDTLRKIAPIVALRNAYKSAEGRKRGGKPHLRPYTGWQAIATVSEGNPRWFIGMLSALMALHRREPSLPVSRADQGIEVTRASQAFVEKLKAVAIEDNNGITARQSVYSLLQQIGASFERSLLDDDFAEEPPLRFEVDAKITPEVENVLRLAMNFGGIVCYEAPDHVGGFRSLKGKRFRLAFMLAPQFHLPLRSGKSRVLSGLLARAASPPAAEPDQKDIFDV